MPPQRDEPAGAPNPYNLRLVRMLSGEDGIGGGIGDVQYAKKRCVMLANGGLIVADPTEHRIKVFDGSGMFVRSFVCRKSNYDTPLQPDMIVLDSQNRVIAADKDRGLVGILDISGKFIMGFGVEKYGKSRRISDIRITSQDNIIVVSEGETHNSHDLGVFAPSGARLGETELEGKWLFNNDHMLASERLYDFTKINTKKPQAIVSKDIEVHYPHDGESSVADEERAGIGDAWYRTVGVRDTSCRLTEDMGYGELRNRVGGMATLPDGYKADSKDDAWVWDGNGFRLFTEEFLTATDGKAIVIRTFSTHDQPIFAFKKITAHDTAQTLFKIHGHGVVPVTTDAANRIIIGDHWCVRILNPDCSVKKTITDADGRGGEFGTITAITVDQKNRIVVAGRCHGKRGGHARYVRTFDADGEARPTEFKRITDMLESYPKMARDSHDRVIDATKELSMDTFTGGTINVPDSSGTSIIIRDSSGNDVKKITVGGAHSERIKFADALTVDRWDRIITVDLYRLTIRFFDHEGELIRAVPGTSIGGKSLEIIHGIAADGMGRIVISGRDKNGVALIQVFGPGNKTRKNPSRSEQRTMKRGMDPLRILKVRYTKGEITDEQFDAMKKRLA